MFFQNTEYFQNNYFYKKVIPNNYFTKNNAFKIIQNTFKIISKYKILFFKKSSPRGMVNSPMGFLFVMLLIHKLQMLPCKSFYFQNTTKIYQALRGLCATKKPIKSSPCWMSECCKTTTLTGGNWHLQWVSVYSREASSHFIPLACNCCTV